MEHRLARLMMCLVYGIKNRDVPAMPDDYDPRIRGKIIHDFSAPRPRRNIPARSACAQEGTSDLRDGASPCPTYDVSGLRARQRTGMFLLCQMTMIPEFVERSSMTSLRHGLAGIFENRRVVTVPFYLVIPAGCTRLTGNLRR
jgi:hypothetical protein